MPIAKTIFGLELSMLRHLHAYIAASCLLAGFTVVNATAQTDGDFTHCDLRVEDTVVWAYSGEAVTLSTHVTHNEDEGYPAAHMSLTLADGKILDLGTGGKYIDDYGETPPSCADIADVAKSQTLASLTGQAVEGLGVFKYSKSAPKPMPERQTLSSMWAYSVMGQDCMDSANLPDGQPSYDCQRASDFSHLFRASDTMKTLSNERMRRLVEENAPIIVVKRSAYYAETFVYDSKTQSLEYVMTDGC